MKRSEAFQPTRQPLTSEPLLSLSQHRVTGPLPFLNPTRAHFHHDARPDIRYKWTSRNNRKGRHALIVHSTAATAALKQSTPRSTSSIRSVLHNVGRMLTYYPVWDVSFDVAYVFTLGSVIWVINAFFVWLPLVRPRSEFTNEELYGGGITAFIGATVFEVGSILLMAEAINENRSGCFGWALERSLSHDKEDGAVDVKPENASCTHHHSNRRNLVGKGGHAGADNSTKNDAQPGTRTWVWCPSAEALRTHYLHSLGFLASLAQLLGATIFWISGLTALPGIYDRMSRPLTIALYWTPQVLGGLGFIVSGTLFMLETQSAWWKPAPKTLGWWIGAWNLVGGVGFTVCPAFGYDRSSWAQYQACLSTFWGSWAFLIGSVIQWYESLEKFPVEVEQGVGGGEATGAVS
jgi:hypothetical protein